MPKGSGLSRKSASLRNLKIGVLLGGTSPEREISIKSGKAVAQALAARGCTVSLIDPADFPRNRCVFGDIDAAFVALHGEGGEDGFIQKQLERKGIPYTGSSPRGCALSLDKDKAKKVFRRSGIPTPDSRLMTTHNFERILKSFPAPFFVKPPQDGSSLGIFQVENASESRAGIRQALRRYRRLLIERKIEGREFTVGVLGSKALPVIELRPKAAFYDYQTKYTKGRCDYHVPAPIPAALTRKLQRLALAVHKVLELRDFSRTDIMVDGQGRPFVLEANAIPGFTALSLVPKAAAHAGIPFENLCERLLKYAVRRGRALSAKR